MRIILFIIWLLLSPLALLKPDEKPSRKLIAQMVFGRFYALRHVILIAPFLLVGGGLKGYELFTEHQAKAKAQFEIEKAKAAEEAAKQALAPKPEPVKPKPEPKPVKKVVKSAKPEYYNYFVFKTVDDCLIDSIRETGYEDMGSCGIKITGQDTVNEYLGHKQTGFAFAFPRDGIHRKDDSKRFYFPIYYDESLNQYRYGSGHLVKESGFYAGKPRRMTLHKLKTLMLGADKEYSYTVEEVDVSHIKPKKVDKVSIEKKAIPAVELKDTVSKPKAPVEYQDSNAGAVDLTILERGKKQSFNFHVFREVSECKMYEERSNNQKGVSFDFDCDASFPSNTPMNVQTVEEYQLSGLVSVVQRKKGWNIKGERLSYYPIFKLVNAELASPDLPLYIYSNGKKAHTTGFYPFSLSKNAVEQLLIK